LPYKNLSSVGVTFTAGAVFVVAGATDMNFIQRTVATVVVMLAACNVASDAEIDIIHNNLR
jgi:hypothetical protein